MTESYIPILLLLGVAIFVPFMMMNTSRLLGPRRRQIVKEEAYESGVRAVGSTREGISVKFYRVAILFLIFDVEAALLYPWAVLFREKMPTWGPIFLWGELAIFSVILMAGYLYAWKRGALEWD